MGKSAGREKDVYKNGKTVTDRQLTSFLPLAFFYFYFFSWTGNHVTQGGFELH